MRRTPAIVLLGLLLVQTAVAGEFPVLVYHDITAVRSGDEYAVSLSAFREQMAFLHAQGYRTLSLRDLDEIAAGRMSLPPRPVMISFDDGLASFAQLALPVLEEHGQQAILSVVTGWLDGRNVPPEYVGRLLDWEALRRVSRSPRVEVLAHTDALHLGIAANPQGNLAPASSTRRYDRARDRYESEAEFRRRLHADLARAAQRLRAETGRAPTGIAWPYGHADQAMMEEAGALGLRWQLTVGDTPARTAEFPRVTRALLRRAETLAAFEEALHPELGRRPLRFAVIDLDAMPAAVPAAQDQWLAALLARLQLLRVNAVLVNPFSADRRQAYFRNGQLPVRTEVLNRVLHQLRTRLGVNHLLLRIPALPGIASMAAELARRHPYDGILLDAGHGPGATALQQVFRYYQPASRCGTSGDAAIPGCTDFRVVSLAPGRLPENLDRLANGPTPSYFLVHGAATDDSRLIVALRALRRAGARHYGIEDGAYLDDPARLRRVAVELGGHAISGARN